MPMFNGLNFFGAVLTERSAPAPVDVQLAAFPGVDGVLALNLGSRGGRTFLRGILLGLDYAELDALQATFRGHLMAHTVGPYVSEAIVNLGPTYLESFQPSDEEARWHPGYGWGLEYQAVFVHLR